MRVVCNVVCWAELLPGSGPIRDPGFMNPTMRLAEELRSTSNFDVIQVKIKVVELSVLKATISVFFKIEGSF